MARTKQTARKSTGGKAPRRTGFFNSQEEDQYPNNNNNNSNNSGFNFGTAVFSPFNTTTTTTPAATATTLATTITLATAAVDDVDDDVHVQESTTTNSNNKNNNSDDNDDDGDKESHQEDQDQDMDRDGDGDDEEEEEATEEKKVSKKSSSNRSPSRKRVKLMMNVEPRERHTRRAKQVADDAMKTKAYDLSFNLKAELKTMGKDTDYRPRSTSSGSDDDSEDYSGDDDSDEYGGDDEKPKKKPAQRRPRKTPGAATGGGGVKKTRAPRGAAKAVKAPKKPRASPCTFTPTAELLEKLEKMVDTTFSSTSSEVASNCSPLVSSREAIRAVLIKDYELLQKVVNDYEHVSNFCIARGVDCNYNALDLALRANDLVAAKILMKGPTVQIPVGKSRVHASSSLLAHGTGSYSRFTYGKAIRAIHAARGSKEGIGALTKDNRSYGGCYYNFSAENAIKSLRYNLTKETINFLVTDFNARWQLEDTGLYEAVEAGNLDVAFHLMEALSGSLQYNFLHMEALKLRKDEEEFTKFQARSVTKKGGSTGITPVHFAAINPNPKFLQELISHVGIHVVDNKNRKPIHFAAACASSATVKLLIEKGAALDEADKSKRTPLHYAAKAGRTHNIEYLLPADMMQIANGRDTFGFTPMHTAAFFGHADFVQELISRGVDPNVLDSRKETPLFSAAKAGHLDVVKILLENGASIAKQDKHRRCALLLAVLNGQYDVVKYLISKGANPDAADSSGNHAMHYACAYGWLSIVKLLHEAGASLTSANDWKKTPLSVAFLKGFTEVCDYLLAYPGVDVNLVDENGQTMLHNILDSKNADTFKLASFLVKDKKAKVDIVDSEGNTVFHILCASTHADDLNIAEMLLEHGAHLDTANKEGVRPLDKAFAVMNISLIKYLLQNNASIKFEKQKSNLLHGIMTQQGQNIQQLFETLVTALHDRDENALLVEMANSIDERGRLPLHVMVQHINPTGFVRGEKFIDNEVNSDDEGDQIPSFTPETTQPMAIEEDNEGDVDFEPSNEHEDDDDDNFIENEENEENEDEDEDEDDDAEDEDMGTFVVGKFEKTGTRNISNDVTLFTEFLSYYLKVTKSNINTPIVEVQQPETKDESDEEVDSDADESDSDDDYGARSSNQTSPKIVQDNIGYTPLHIVVNHLNATTITFLIEKLNAKVNVQDSKGRTPLHFAMDSAGSNDQNAYGICKYLFSKGAKLTIVDYHERPPTFYLFTNLVKASNQVAKPFNSFGYGSSFGFNRYSSSYGSSQPSSSSSAEPIDVLSDFSTFSGFSATHKDKDGKTMLHFASGKGFTICSMLLIQLGCNINEKDSLGNTPLAYAILNNRVEFAVGLINKGADYNIEITQEVTETVQEEDYSTRSTIGKKEKKKANTVVKKKVSSLFKHALALNAFGLAFLLASKDIEPTRAINDALETKMYQMAANLISKSQSNALQKIDPATGENLLHVVAKFNTPGFEPYSRKIIKLLHTRGLKLDSTDKSGKSPLHNSVLSNGTVTRYLLKHGAKVNIQDKDKKNVLHYVSRENMITLVQTLLRFTGATEALNAKDQDGKTPLHYAVSYSKFGSFENTELVKLLVNCGAKSDIVDKLNNSPLFYAWMQQSRTIANAFKDLSISVPNSIKERAQKEYELYKEQFFKADGTFAKLDIKADAEKARSALEAQQEQVKTKPQVHKSLKKKGNSVLLDDNGKPYDILLSKVDITVGEFGANMFYKQQIIHNKAQDLYIFLTNWGRVGESGQHQQTPLSKDEAIIEFKKNFRSKTANNWDERETNFKQAPGKYSIVQLAKTKVKENLKPIDLTGAPPSKLDSRVQNLMGLLCDVTIMQKNLQHYGIDLTIARLHKSILLEALEVLNQTKEVLTKFEDPSISAIDKKAHMDEVYKLTNRFYQLIPHTQFRDSAIPALRMSDVTEKRKMLEDLIELQITSRIILASTTQIKNMNPLDYTYNAIKTHLSPIGAADEDYPILERYINRSSQTHKIMNIFRVSRGEEQERFKRHSNDKNRMLLFHGSSVTNIISILSQGLKIAPPEAPPCGYYFGKGIYTADVVDKSLGYCNAHVSGGVVCMLLCEVALGDSCELKSGMYMEKPVDGYQSTKGVGKVGPDFGKSFVTFDGMKIPCGPVAAYPYHLSHNATLNYNEYIVYDESRVRIRYLVQMKPNCKY